MRRLFRILLNAMSLLSLLVCSLTLYVWLSGREEMIWVGESGYHTFEMGWHDGRIFAGSITLTLAPPAERDASRWTFHHVESWRDDGGWSGAPGVFRWDFKPQQGSTYVLQPREVSASCWVIALVTCILPLVKLPRFIRWFSRDVEAGH